MSKSRVFLYFLLAFLAGVAARSFFAPPYFLYLALALSAGATAAASVSRKKFLGIACGLFITAFLIGMIRLDFFERSSYKPSAFYGKIVELQGVVRDEPGATSQTERLKLKVAKVDGVRASRPFFVLVTKWRHPEYRLGDELSVRGRIEPPENFDDFDYVSYLAKEGVFAVASFPQIEKISEGNAGVLRAGLNRVKLAFEDKIERIFPEPHAGFLKGITLGERAALPAELLEKFNVTGTRHIIVLSGLHLAMISTFLLFLVIQVFRIPYAWAFGVSSLMIILFVLMVGAPPSAVRAGVMGVLVLLAQREGRMYSARNAIALAGAAMVFHNPLILRFDAAFQLSFLATLGMIYLSPHINLWIDKARSYIALYRGRIPAKIEFYEERYVLFSLRRVLVQTLSAQLAVLPLLIYLFGRVSPVSPLANILVVPAVPYAMFFGFLAGMLGMIWEPLGRIVMPVGWMFLEYKLQMIEFFARLPLASVETSPWVFSVFLIAGAMILWKFKKTLTRL